MAKKKKKIVHIGMGKMLCGLNDKHVRHSVWSSNKSKTWYETFLSKDERFCHKCWHIHKQKTGGA
jgi:hypothetical protein